MAEYMELSSWVNLLLVSGLGAGMAVSVRERRKKRQWRSAPQTSLQSPLQNPLQSPLSTALAQLVGTAGGIYLSLEVLCSFLRVKHEDWQAAISLPLDPLAAFSLIVAILQPFVVKAWDGVKNIRDAAKGREPERISKGKVKKRR